MPCSGTATLCRGWTEGMIADLKAEGAIVLLHVCSQPHRRGPYPEQASSLTCLLITSTLLLDSVPVGFAGVSAGLTVTQRRASSLCSL
jgi:hypothetical protein